MCIRDSPRLGPVAPDGDARGDAAVDDRAGYGLRRGLRQGGLRRYGHERIQPRAADVYKRQVQYDGFSGRLGQSQLPFENPQLRLAVGTQVVETDLADDLCRADMLPHGRKIAFGSLPRMYPCLLYTSRCV